MRLALIFSWAIDFSGATNTGDSNYTSTPGHESCTVYVTRCHKHALRYAACINELFFLVKMNIDPTSSDNLQLCENHRVHCHIPSVASISDPDLIAYPSSATSGSPFPSCGPEHFHPALTASAVAHQTPPLRGEDVFPRPAG